MKKTKTSKLIKEISDIFFDILFNFFVIVNKLCLMVDLTLQIGVLY